MNSLVFYLSAAITMAMAVAMAVAMTVMMIRSLRSFRPDAMFIELASSILVSKAFYNLEASF